MSHTYYRTVHNELFSLSEVDRALKIMDKLHSGYTVVELKDDELFSRGNKIEAIMRFAEKYNVPLKEAKAAIEFMRSNDDE